MCLGKGIGFDIWKIKETLGLDNEDYFTQALTGFQKLMGIGSSGEREGFTHFNV
jgi:hypothetical protein